MRVVLTLIVALIVSLVVSAMIWPELLPAQHYGAQARRIRVVGAGPSTMVYDVRALLPSVPPEPDAPVFSPPRKSGSGQLLFGNTSGDEDRYAERDAAYRKLVDHVQGSFLAVKMPQAQSTYISVRVLGSYLIINTADQQTATGLLDGLRNQRNLQLLLSRVLLVGALTLPLSFLGQCVLVRRRNARRSRLGLCQSCGYDLRASSGRCPECGAVYEDGSGNPLNLCEISKNSVDPPLIPKLLCS